MRRFLATKISKKQQRNGAFIMEGMVKYYLKSGWFILKAAIIAGILVFLFWGSFAIMERLGNMYIISTDGMKKRAEVIISNQDMEELPEYFTEGFLQSDNMTLDSPFKQFEMPAFTYDLKVRGMWVLPWSSEGNITAEEIVRISSTKKIESIPEYENKKYEIKMVMDKEGRWLIDGLKAVK